VKKLQRLCQCRSLVIAASLNLLAAPAAHAAYTLTIAQVGPDVVATGDGSINLTALTAYGPSTDVGNVWPSFSVGASQGVVSIGPTSPVSVDGYTGASGPTNLGTGPQVFATSGSGSLVGIAGGAAGAAFLYVPQNYVSSAALGPSTSIWAGTTTAALGLRPGSYTWTWGSGATADGLTLTIQGSPLQTPVPALDTLGKLALAGLLGASAVAAMRRKQA